MTLASYDRGWYISGIDLATKAYIIHIPVYSCIFCLQKQRKKRKAPPEARFMALHLIHDPQDFAEKLFRRLEKATEKFELRLMMMALIARLTGVHQVAWGGCGLKPGVGVA